MADTTKTVLGNYELQRVLGDGAEGRVYQAVCAAKTSTGVKVGEQVAIKRLFKKAGQEKEPQQFRRQVEILSKLDHPNIVRYRDSFVWRETELEEDLHCLVMELLDGEPLKTVLEKSPRGLPWEKARHLLLPILEALRHASERGVIHRDLKPSNIHITSSGTPKLVDFGIARHEDGDADATSSTAGAKGTFDYMAPDFAKDGKFRGDEQSDIFSFGVILHQALTGALPFPALGDDANRGYFIRWIGGQAAPAPDFRHPVFRVLNQVGAFINKCIHPDRTQRFKTFAEVSVSFQQIGFRKLKHGTETYEFVEWLGKGGFGEVFKAKRVRDQRMVAIKRLFGVEQSSRFIREAKILREAAHPNLTEYVDFVEAKVRDDEKEFYLILEYLDGMPGAGLRERIKASVSGLEPVETLQLFARYLDCLHHLHRNGIIHRDLKPGNLYAPAGQPQRAKIFDLGIAHDDDGTKTRGQVPGTLDYMPPEFASQSSGRGSAQSDLYSLGITLFQALTRKLPFPRLPKAEAEAWVEFFRRSEKPLSVAFDHAVFQAKPELVPLLQRCLAHNSAERFPTAAAMRDEVNGVLIRWELKAAGRNPDQGTEATLFVKSTAVTMPNGVIPPKEPLPSLEQELQKAAEEIPPQPAPEVVAALVSEPAPPPEVPAVVEPDPVEVENERLLAEEAARKNKDAELERLGQLTKEAEERAAEAAARRKLMEAKWQEDEEKRKAEELAAQELQHQAEAEEAEKKRLAREERAKQMAEIKAKIAQHVADARTKAVQLGQAIKSYAQNAISWLNQKWRSFGGFGGLLNRAKAFAGKIILFGRKTGQTLAQKISAARSSEQVKNAGINVNQLKARFVTGATSAIAALKSFSKRSFQKWRGIPQKTRIIILSSAAVVLVVVCVLTYGGTRSVMRANAYDQAAKQAQAAFKRGDFSAANSAAEKALAIRNTDPVLQQLAHDSWEQYKLRASFEESLTNGQVALNRQDYTNALQWAEAALKKSPDDEAAQKLQETAKQQLEDYLEAVGDAREAFNDGKFAKAETYAARALELSAKDVVMLQLKADAHARLLAIAAYRDAMAKAEEAFDASDFTNAVTLANEAAKTIPGDVDAAHLRARAQKNLDDYHQAVADARAAFTNANYLAAQESADAALEFYKDDSAMQTLKAEASQRFKNQKAYVDSLKNAQAAFERLDYNNALRFANAALSNAPGDRTATRLRDSAQKIIDEHQATVTAAMTAFKNGDYVAAETNAELALAIYANDSGMSKLKNAALEQLGNQKAFQVEMTAARAAVARNDFAAAVASAGSALKKIPNDPAAIKLKSEAEQSLKSLNETASQAQTAYALENYDSALALADKVLSLQNQNAPMLQLRSKILRRLDGKLAGLLASFGMATPPELKYAEINLPAKLGPIGDAGRPYYQAQVGKLEKTFRAGNWLTEDNRQTVINNLTKAINTWE